MRMGAWSRLLKIASANGKEVCEWVSSGKPEWLGVVSDIGIEAMKERARSLTLVNGDFTFEKQCFIFGGQVLGRVIWSASDGNFWNGRGKVCS